MNDKEILESNKLVAEFMAVEVMHGPDWDRYNMPDGTGATSQSLHYHDNWNWLMPVVEKINIIDNFEFSVTIFTMDCRIENQKGVLVSSCELIHTPDELIKSVWSAIVEFIKWYNENNSTNE